MRRAINAQIQKLLYEIRLLLMGWTAITFFRG
jgi:hypothetical protein